MFDNLYKALETISLSNGDCKILVGRQIVKRFAYNWHTGTEQYEELIAVADFKGMTIKVEDTENFDVVKAEILKVDDVTAT